MSNWTQAKDAWIAEHCEGLRVTGPYINGDYHHPVPNYLTDPAACIRAAEAWRKKGKLRIVRLSLHSRGCSARLYDGLNWINEGPHSDPAAALAQALYRATGGPA